MKVLFVFHDRTNYTGGPALNAVRLLPHLNKLGVSVISACIYPKGQEHPNGDALEKSGVQVVYKEREVFSEPLALWFLKIVKVNDIDLVVSNINIQAALLCKTLQPLGIPVIHTHRSNDILNNGVADFFLKEDNSWSLPAYVFVSEYLRKQYPNILPSIQTRIIYSGVESSQYRTNFADFNLIKVIYSGRIEQKQKNIIDIANEFIRLIKEGRAYEFTILGSGSKADEVQEAINSSGCQNKIKMIPTLYGVDYKKELAKHHVILLYSDFEGTPGSILDAMSCGLIPVSSNYEGVEEVIEKEFNGYILEHLSELDKVLCALGDNITLAKEMSQRNLELIQTKFSIEIAARKWIEFINQVYYFRVSIEDKCFPKKIKLPKKHNLLFEHRSWNDRPFVKRCFYKLKYYINHRNE